jgi:hypothetical protein
MNCFFFPFRGRVQRDVASGTSSTRFYVLTNSKEKHSASFTMEIVSHNSHTRLFTCVTYNSTRESWGLESGHGRIESARPDLCFPP